jgi:DNA-directed RNA polymerase sigma subunit (sigma70/sigma32)
MSKELRHTQTQVETITLSPLEEKVVRMRHGFAAPGDLILEQMGQGHPETQERLREIERRALVAAGPRHGSTKRKIVSALRSRGF